MIFTVVIGSDNLISIANSASCSFASFKYFLQEDGSKYKFDTYVEAAKWVIDNIKPDLIDYECSFIKTYQETPILRAKYLKQG